MVAAKHPLAAQAGIHVLRLGGSAVDAAIATSVASGVVEPYMSGIGGGGMAIYAAKDTPPRVLHFAMRAPASATADMYQVLPGTHDQDLFGWPRTAGDANVSGPSSIALPAQVDGLYRLWQLGGTIPWAELIQPAARLAADGFPVDWLTSLRTLEGQDLLSRFPASRAIFLSRGRPPKPELALKAEILRQEDLGRTLQAIARDPAALGKDRVAPSIAEAAAGRIDVAEMGSRPPLEGDALSISFGGLDVHLVPWATGGPTVLEWLGILRELDPPADEADPDFWWAIVRSGEVALHDRLERLADPAFVPFPDEILEPGYYRRMAEAIRADEVGPVFLPPLAGSTSHLAVVDAQGNAVTLTQSLLSLWGSGVTAAGTGIVLNNGMMWFDPEPGHANSIAGGKLPLANMCPVLVTKDEAPYLVYGASGGRRILSAAVQILIRVTLLGQSLAEAMAAPRLEISNQEVRADIRFDPAFCDDLAKRLSRPVVLKAHPLGSSPWASPIGLMRLEDGSWTGGADPYTMACVLAV